MIHKIREMLHKTMDPIKPWTTFSWNLHCRFLNHFLNIMELFWNFMNCFHNFIVHFLRFMGCSFIFYSKWSILTLDYFSFFLLIGNSIEQYMTFWNFFMQNFEKRHYSTTFHGSKWLFYGFLMRFYGILERFQWII